jgi:hypothetical protein
MSPAVANPIRDRDESWEMVVGTSWLNKIGVLVSIVGVALLVSYSFAHIGPGGRVAIGYLLSASMLAAGVVLERRDTFRNYAYGLVAGGWAGIYFTTFAMHDVAAAKIIDNDLLAVALLSLAAAGMVAHSLRYRSQVVTSLAFIVAYTTLALSPLSGFALAAVRAACGGDAGRRAVLRLVEHRRARDCRDVRHVRHSQRGLSGNWTRSQFPSALRDARQLLAGLRAR